MSTLSVSIVQTNIFWESPKANVSHLEELFSRQIEKTDLIVLPEMFSTGFSMNPDNLGEFRKGYTQRWMQQIAGRYNTAITGSIIYKDGTHAFNRLLWVTPDGAISSYDKKYGFSPAKEDQFFKAGEKNVVFEHKGFKIMPQICYELRFPESSRNLVVGFEEGETLYDLLLYVANWPTPRINHWDALLKARAIENQAYTIGCNPVTEFPNGMKYNGHSKAIHANGDILADLESHDGIKTLTLDLEELKAYRKSLPFIYDQK